MVKRPNTRVQRTRSLPSALREPLTRYPFGGSGNVLGEVGVVITLLAGAACVSSKATVQRLASPCNHAWTLEEVRPQASRAFRGVVYQGQPGDRASPMSSAKITLRRVGSTKTTLLTVGKDGRFDDSSIKLGEYEVLVCADGGFTTADGRVTIGSAASEVSLEFWLDLDT
jgi:hypothetical protein